VINMSLTEKRIARALTAGKRARLADSGTAGVRGLYLCVDGKAAASWAFRYQLNHSSHWMGLGSTQAFNLAEARERARAARQKLADGIDPLATRQAERAAREAKQASVITFAEAAKRWHAAMSPKWTSPKHASQVIDRLTKWVVPIIGKHDVAAVDTPEVMKILQQEVGEEGKSFWSAHAVTASRVRRDIQQVLDWAAVGGYRPATLPNPARWTGHLAHLLSPPRAVRPVKGHAALSFRAVPTLMAELAKHQGIAAKALQFLILSSARLGEVAGAEWGEINLDEAVWIVPASRMKARREWRQPLAPEVIELLKDLPREANNKYVFVGREGGGLSQNAIRITLRRAGYDYGEATVHGFRSAFSDWAHETSSFSPHAIELSLAHSVGSESERAYRRGDQLQKRRELMAAWARFCLSPPAESADKVIPIGSARR
jgi:integrase